MEVGFTPWRELVRGPKAWRVRSRGPRSVIGWDLRGSSNPALSKGFGPFFCSSVRSVDFDILDVFKSTVVVDSGFFGVLAVFGAVDGLRRLRNRLMARGELVTRSSCRDARRVGVVTSPELPRPVGKLPSSPALRIGLLSMSLMTQFSASGKFTLSRIFQMKEHPSAAPGSIEHVLAQLLTTLGLLGRK